MSAGQNDRVAYIAHADDALQTTVLRAFPGRLFVLDSENLLKISIKNSDVFKVSFIH